jgi:hypothetical protein
VFHGLPDFLIMPLDVEEKLRQQSANLAADVMEAYALELFRRGKLTHYEISRVLGLDRVETDAGSSGGRSSTAR